MEFSFSNDSDDVIIADKPDSESLENSDSSFLLSSDDEFETKSIQEAFPVSNSFSNNQIMNLNNFSEEIKNEILSNNLKN